MPKKIFITGAGGFVGSVLVNGFKDLNYEVHALDKFYNYKINKSPRIVIYKYDLQKFINNIKINSVDYLIHAAAITNPKNKRIKNNLMDINLSLILSSLNLAKKLNVKKYYFASSTAIYGYHDNILEYDENTKPILKNDYAISKKIGEEIVREFCNYNNMDFKIFRFGNIYSGFEKISWSRSKASLIQKWIDTVNKGGIMKTDSFKTKRDWTYARDIPLVLNNIMSSKRKHPQIINLVSPFIKSDLQMMKIINKNMHLSNISFKENKKYKNIIKPTRSKYLYKFKFTEWTSPEKAIKKIWDSNT